MTVTIDLASASDYECPHCRERSARTAFHADASKAWVDCLCPNGHIWQVVTMPLEGP